MTRIDRYLVYLYFRVLVICFVSLAGLLIVIHVFSNLDEFLRYRDQSESSLLKVLVDYYGPYTLSIYERLSGLLALLALLFVIAWLNRTHEFTALMSAGITKRRVVRPLMVSAALVILSAAGLRELAIPKFQDRLDRNPQDLTGELPRSIRPTFDTDAQALFQGRHLLPTKMQIVDPLLKIQGGPLGNALGSKILATSAQYLPASPDRPAGYLFEQVKVPKRIDEHDAVTTSEGQLLLLTSKNHPWIGSGNCYVISRIEFEMLRGGSAWKQFASTGELIAHLRREKRRSGNDLRVLIHQRILRPAVDWTVLLLGLPVLLMRPDRHMFWVAGNCLFVVAGFTAFVMGVAALGSSGSVLSPTLACWMPLLVFAPWGWARTGSAMES